MRTRSVLQAAAIAVGIIAATTGGAFAATFTNGSFEDVTNFTPDGNDTDALAGGSTAMPGWTVTGGSVAWIGPTNPFGLAASNGGYFLDLTSYASGNGNGVEQSFTTVKNGEYTVTFDLGGGNGVSIDAGANGASQTFSGGLLSTQTSWDPQTFTFVAAGNTSLLSFVGIANPGGFIGLDHVQVAFNGIAATTPIPGSVVMLGTALLGLGLVGTRRSRNANQADLSAS